MTPNPYQVTRQTMDAVHAAVQQWAERILERAGASDVHTATAFPSEDAPTTLVVFPYRLTLWPKLVENAESISLLGANPRKAAQNGVPDAWMRLAAQMTDALRGAFPSAKNKSGVEVVLPNAPLSSLPKPLAGWFEAQGDEEPGWRVARDGKDYGRLPTVGWMPGIKLRVHYLAQMGGRPPENSTAAGIVSALTVGLHLDRSIEVERPPAPLESRYVDLLRAVAEAAPDALREQMNETIEAVVKTATHSLPVLPHESPASDDFAEIMRTLRRPLQPTLMLQLQVPVAGYPEVLPAVTPQFSTQRMPEPGDEE